MDILRKIRFLGSFWGMTAIGGSGLLLWKPGWSSYFSRVGYGISKGQHIMYVEVQKRQDIFTIKQEKIWHKKGNTIYNFNFYDKKTETLKGVTAYSFDNHFRMTARAAAKSARWERDRWRMEDVVTVVLPYGDFPYLERKRYNEIELREKPTDFVVLQADTSTMGIFELYRYITKLKENGIDMNSSYLTNLHSRIAFPLINIILVLIAMSFSITFNREGGVLKSMGAGVAVGFSYWVFHAFAVAAGTTGSLPPVVAAWAANFILGSLAFFLFRRIRT